MLRLNRIKYVKEKKIFFTERKFMINKKLIILLTLVILLLTFSGVSAADSNDMAINSDKNLLSSDDITTELTKLMLN